MQVLAMRANTVEAPFNGGAPHAENPGHLAQGDLGNEEFEDAEVKAGLLPAIVEAKGLGAEIVAAGQAGEALDAASVTFAAIGTVAFPGKGMVGGAARAGGKGAEGWCECHFWVSSLWCGTQ